ncbi:GNAT family N-acetyltransferase [Telluribacter humicola]|uniref:GNAT family N-acetyltransferase n=1 Tax=Telluribacter humicola TaxID=1720261 RepID=UPI001A9629F7|nr:GNAT family N-acetyltransferase [Telluribacter humicola]
MRIRKARVEDAAQFVRIKEQLPMPAASEGTTTGGFLLGTSESTYAFFIEQAHCLVAEAGGEVVGFGILLPDAIVKASEIWQKRDLAAWEIPIAEFEDRKLCYFEQLAFLPAYRRVAPRLAFRLLHEAFHQHGYEAMFTTTVNKPVTNRAAIPFIKAAGGTRVGNIDEYYEGAGAINSDIYLVQKQDFLSAIEHLNLAQPSRLPAGTME